MINIARSGKFSSDRTIQEYADQIWHVNTIKILITIVIKKELINFISSFLVFNYYFFMSSNKFSFIVK